MVFRQEKAAYNKDFIDCQRRNERDNRYRASEGQRPRFQAVQGRFWRHQRGYFSLGGQRISRDFGIS